MSDFVEYVLIRQYWHIAKDISVNSETLKTEQQEEPKL